MVPLPLPTGTVTFLFTDIQGSTPLWERQPEKMAAALQIHNFALRVAIEANGGVIFKFVGDEYQAVFNTAPQALKAAIQGQRALQAAQWNELGELKVRMGLHIGEAQLDPDGDEYTVSHTKNRIGRIRSAAYGGQILLSQETADLVRRNLPEGVTLKDLGEHRLKGMQTPERLFQVCIPGLVEAFPPLATGITHPNNLPIQRTSFIGREAQVDQVKELLGQHALVTLTGSGGVGKTRLSLQAAGELVEQFADGVWLVELAPITDPGMVVQAVASVLGLKSLGSQTIHEILLEYLHNRQVLLVLDNCEHLIEACAVLVDELLQVCPKLKVLASSREALGVAGEIPFRVPSLDLPDASRLPGWAEMGKFEAVRLFSERARLARPDFQITAHNGGTVVRICQRLDGIPLALELAAARMGILSADQLLQHLDDAFRLLTGGTRTALPRQQTLRATIDWSYRLLSEQERELLRRLAVFSGSFDLEAVEAVCCLEDGEKLDVLDGLASLVNKSIVIAERQPLVGMRYHLLETVRQYAREKLYDAGESQRLHELHATHYLELAREGGRNTYTRDAPAWLKKVDVNFDNIRTAFNWALEKPALGQAIQALNRLGWYWLMRCTWEEGYAWMQKALGQLDPQVVSLERAGLLCQLGLVSVVRPQSVDARECLSLSREMFLELGDQNGYAWATCWLGVTYYGIDRTTCFGYYAESARIFEQLGDDEGQANAVWMWGHNARDAGDLELGELKLKEAESLYRKMGSWKLGDVYFNLARLYTLNGNAPEARRLFAQAVPILQEVNDEWGLMWCTMFMAELELREASDRPGLLQAQDMLLESLETARKLGRRYGHNIHIPILLGKTAHRLGEHNRATCWYQEALALIQEIDVTSIWFDTGGCLLGLAEANASLGRLIISARLLGALDGLKETNGYLWQNFTPEDFEGVVQSVRSALGEPEFERQFAQGWNLTLEQAVALALEVCDG